MIKKMQTLKKYSIAHYNNSKYDNIKYSKWFKIQRDKNPLNKIYRGQWKTRNVTNKIGYSILDWKCLC